MIERTVEIILEINGRVGARQGLTGDVRMGKSWQSAIAIVNHLLSGQSHGHMAPISPSDHF